MTQINLARVFKFMNNLANDSAPAICGHGCLEMNRAIGTVGAGKCTGDRTFERLGAFLAKWRDDANSPCFALMAEIFARSNALSANCAYRRIQKRYCRVQQFKFAKSDHISARLASLSRSM